MSFNPFQTVSNYEGMLNKIAVYTFFVSLGAIALINAELGGVPKQVLSELLKTKIKIPGIEIQVALVFAIAAFFVAWFSSTIKLHDRLSDLLGIRERFDLDCILFPVASASGVALSIAQQQTVRDKREELMRKVFYKYASSSPESPDRIEQHAITMALNQWASYWILVEASAVIFATGIALWVLGKCCVALVLWTIILAIIWSLQPIRTYCRGYARDEIQQILEKESRRNAVREVFNAL